MKKSISAILIAALMLFAFTACDNTTPLYEYTNVEYITIAQTGTLIEGQDATASDFVVSAHYTNNQTQPVQNATIDIDNEANTASASLVVAKGTTLSTGVIDIEKSEVTGIEVSGLDAIDVYRPGNTGSDFNVADEAEIYADIYAGNITVTAVSENGSYTFSGRELAAKGVSISFAPVAVPEDPEFGDTATLVVTKLVVGNYEYVDVEKQQLPLSFNVPARLVEDPDTLIADGVGVVYSVNGSAASTTLGTVYAGDTVNIAVYTLDGDKLVLDVTDSVTELNGTTLEKQVTVSSTTPYSATVAYEGETLNISVPTGVDYVSDVTKVEVAQTSVNNMTPGHRFIASDFTATYTTNTGASSLTTGAPVIAVIGNQAIPTTATASSTVDVQVSVTYSVRGVSTVEYFPVTVTVVNPSGV